MTGLLLVVCSMTPAWRLQMHDHQSWSSNVEPGDRHVPSLVLYILFKAQVSNEVDAVFDNLILGSRTLLQ